MSNINDLPLYMQDFIKEHIKEMNDKTKQMELIDELFILELKEVATPDLIDKLVAYKDSYKLKSSFIQIGIDTLNRSIKKQMDLLEIHAANPIV